MKMYMDRISFIVTNGVHTSMYVCMHVYGLINKQKCHVIPFKNLDLVRYIFKDIYYFIQQRCIQLTENDS